MYRKEQIKGIIAIILFGIIGISFFIFGRDSDLLKFVALGCFILWLISMFFVNRKFEKKD